jgi:aminoglycoside phosphotransferase family enzyme
MSRKMKSNRIISQCLGDLIKSGLNFLIFNSHVCFCKAFKDSIALLDMIYGIHFVLVSIWSMIDKWR